MKKTVVSDKKRDKRKKKKKKKEKDDWGPVWSYSIPIKGN